MELLGRNADFGAQAKLAAVREACGGVDVDRGGIDAGGKAVGSGIVARDDAFAVTGAVSGEVVERVVKAVHDLDREDVVQKFDRIVVFAGRLYAVAQNGARALTAAQLHVLFVERRLDNGKRLLRDVLVYQNGFDGVAHRGTRGFGVVDDVCRHLQIGGLVYIHMAVAHAGFDDRHLGVGDNALDQSGAAARDQHVKVFAQLHQLGRTLARGVLHQRHTVTRQSGALYRVAHDGGDRLVGVDGFLAAAQDHCAAGFETEGGGVARHVGTRLVDNADNAHRNRDFFNLQAVFQGPALQNFADRVRLSGNLRHALRHSGNAALIQL